MNAGARFRVPRREGSLRIQAHSWRQDPTRSDAASTFPLRTAAATTSPDQAKSVGQAYQWPSGRGDDQRKEKKFDGNTGPVALRKAFAHKAKGAQAHRSFRIKQLTVPAVAA